MRGVYWATPPDYENRNDLDADLPLPAAFEDPDRTRMQCVGATVRDVHARGWTHHIPRLMILANIALTAFTMLAAMSGTGRGVVASSQDLELRSSPELFEAVALPQIQGVADDLITSVPTTAIGTKLLIMPTVGIGLDIAPSKFFHIEMQAAGMALSGRSRVLDGEAKAVFRVKKLEVLAGAKGLDFRTTLKTDQYFRSRLTGPFAGVRWVF